jgi:hypothetical protein
VPERRGALTVFQTVALPAALLGVSLIFVLQPSLVYDPGPFFPFPLWEALAVLAACGIALAAVLTLPVLFGDERWRDDYGAFLAAAALGLWASSLLSAGLPAVLDGRQLQLSPSLEESVLNIGLVMAAASLCYFIGRRRVELMRFFLWVLNGLFAATAIAIAIDTPSMPTSLAADRETVATYSRNGNVVTLLLDTYQASLFAELIKEDPGLRDQLQGFQFFPNAKGVAPTTMFSVPAIHSGEAYSPEAAAAGGFYKYFDYAVKEKSFLSSLAAAGYRSDLINPILQSCPNGTRCMSEHLLHAGHGAVLAKSSLLLLGLSLYTVAPLQWKQFAYNDGEWLLGEDPMRSLVTRGYSTLEWMAQSIKIDDGAPTAKFFHLFVTHSPAVMTTECAEKRNLRLTDETLLDQARCANRAALKFLSALQTYGVYNDSTIIVLADHGAGVSNEGFYSGAAASPLLLLKEPHSSGPLEIREQPISVLDIGQFVCDATGHCNSTISDEFGNRARTSLFMDYRWLDDGWSTKREPEVNWYSVDGPPARFDSWRRVAPKVPEVSLLNGDARDAWGNYGLGWVDIGDKAGARWVFGSVASLYLSLPERRLYSVLVSIEPNGADQGSLGVEIHSGGARKASQQFASDSANDVLITVQGNPEAPTEFVFRTTGVGAETFSLERRRPLFRIQRLQVQ